MPVIVVGADTDLGHVIVPALRLDASEIRLFATDDTSVARYRSFAKVAVGDISDGSHVGGAATGAFCAVVIADAAEDERERHFASTPQEVFAHWADGLADAGIKRVIVVGSPQQLGTADVLRVIDAEYITVDIESKPAAVIAAEVAAAEAAG